MNAFRSRLTFANVTSVTALVFARAGGAYALTGIPDRGGVFHGCVDPKTGALRVVRSASACHKTRTVKRGNRRVRIPGESAIAWNQQGRPGVTGVTGVNGVNGSNGANGATNVVVRKSTTMPALAATGDADCNPGERAVGGGASRSDGSQASTDVIRTSFPVSVQGTGLPAPAGATPTAWHSSFDTGQTMTPVNITFHVICASA